VALGTAAVPLAAVTIEGFRFDHPFVAMAVILPGMAAAWIGGLLATDHPLLSEIGGRARVLSRLGACLKALRHRPHRTKPARP
jgi:hypothetical protein